MIRVSCWRDFLLQGSPTGATHLALIQGEPGPGREGDLCRGQGSSSLAVAVSVFAVGGAWGQGRTGTFADGDHFAYPGVQA